MMTSSNTTSDRFHTADYVTLCLVLAASCGVGVYYGCAIAVADRRRRKRVADGVELPVNAAVPASIPASSSSTEEFLMGGRRMSAIPVSLSLFVSWLSAVSFIGDPVEVYHYGIVYWIIGIGYCIGLPAVAHVFAPVYFRMRLTSVFEVRDVTAFEHFKRQLKTVLLRDHGLRKSWPTCLMTSSLMAISLVTCYRRL